jgi:cellulose synthase/poly-beta-1,6-N-acetylglucosamine synthase-like glycosyltransferase
MAESYGIEKVNFKILDDSNDDTSLEIDQIVEEFSKKHIRIEVLRRGDRKGFKAGALQAALERTEEEFIAIFDADFIPSEDFLLRTMPYFGQNDRLGIVQSRWTHLNRDYNQLTKAIALGIDVHFLIEQTGRYAAGLFQNFNGSGGVLRKKAILGAGGWQSDTLAEDLDLSYRMQNRDYQILFLKDLNCPGEIPPTVPSFKKQQGRWACGSLRTAKKILPTLLLNRKIGWKQRLQAFIHLTSYLLHPLMLLSFILICLVTLIGVNNVTVSNSNFLILFDIYRGAIITTTAITIKYLVWGLLLAAIVICTAAPWISMIVILKSQNLSVKRNLISLLITFLLGFGISLNNTIEAGKALLTNRNWEFSRTPKYANLINEQDWKMRKYQIPLDFTWILEFSLICLGGIAIGIATLHSNIGGLLILVPCTVAYAFVFFLTIIQSRKEKAS